MPVRNSLSMTLLALVAACGGSAPPPDPEPRDSNVFEPLTDTIDRAQSVQQTVDEQAAEMRRRIEDAER